MENEVNSSTIHLLEYHVSGVEGVRLNAVEEKDTSIFLTTAHVYVDKVKIIRPWIGCI